MGRVEGGRGVIKTTYILIYIIYIYMYMTQPDCVENDGTSQGRDKGGRLRQTDASNLTFMPEKDKTETQWRLCRPCPPSTHVAGP